MSAVATLHHSWVSLAEARFRTPVGERRWRKVIVPRLRALKLLHPNGAYDIIHTADLDQAIREGVLAEDWTAPTATLPRRDTWIPYEEV